MLKLYYLCEKRKKIARKITITEIGCTSAGFFYQGCYTCLLYTIIHWFSGVGYQPMLLAADHYYS